MSEILEKKTALIRSFYKQGLSTRQVAVLTDVSKSQVALLCKDIARSKSMAAVLRQPAKSTHWRTSRCNARRAMERVLGRKLLRSEHVHHINGDYTDNNLGNLAILPASQHNYQHTKERLLLGWKPPATKGRKESEKTKRLKSAVLLAVYAKKYKRPPIDKESLASLYNSGLSLRKVAALVGCTSSTVQKHLKHMGLILRKAGWHWREE